LRLDAIQQHASNLVTVDHPTLENVLCRPVLLLIRIGRRKQLITCTANRLKAAAAAERRIVLNRVEERYTPQSRTPPSFFVSDGYGNVPA
jgi:hypothetical protein